MITLQKLNIVKQVASEEGARMLEQKGFRRVAEKSEEAKQAPSKPTDNPDSNGKQGKPVNTKTGKDKKEQEKPVKDDQTGGDPNAAGTTDPDNGGSDGEPQAEG